MDPKASVLPTTPQRTTLRSIRLNCAANKDYGDIKYVLSFFLNDLTGESIQITADWAELARVATRSK